MLALWRCWPCCQRVPQHRCWQRWQVVLTQDKEETHNELYEHIHGVPNSTHETLNKWSSEGEPTDNQRVQAAAVDSAKAHVRLCNRKKTQNSCLRHPLTSCPCTRRNTNTSQWSAKYHTIVLAVHQAPIDTIRALYMTQHLGLGRCRCGLCFGSFFFEFLACLKNQKYVRKGTITTHMGSVCI